MVSLYCYFEMTVIAGNKGRDGSGGSRLAWLLRAIALIACLLWSVVMQAAEGIELASVHAVVGDLSKGEVLYAKRDDVDVPIASITKLMTAMVVLDGGQPLDEWIPVVARDDTAGKNGYSRLRIGSETTRGQLLRLALMSSENLAAYLLAFHYPGGLDAFTAAMNAKAERLGMTRTRFDDPSGLSIGNRSSASDLLKMVLAAYEYETIRDYSKTYQYTARFRRPRYTLSFGNTNPLTASSRWNVALSKTGYLDEAGRCLVMVAEIEGVPVAMVLLNSFGTRTPLGDAARVRRWLQTGSSGSIAGAALQYERRVAARYDN
jgi:D-alanyl-D-alanine endopeptidase (penicillin-binding protein 7)